jgi:hypothetical protein
MNAPERVWLDWPGANKGEPVFDEPPETETQAAQTKYVRADVAEAAVAAAVQAERARCAEGVAAAKAAIEANGGEPVAIAMLLHIAETLAQKGRAVLTVGNGDFGQQVLEFAAAIRAGGA